MADSEFEKTVKLTPGSTPAGDKTVKLTPEQDKTLKLDPEENPSEPVTEESSTPPVPPPPMGGKPSKILKINIAALVLVILLAVSWFFVPNFLKSSAEKLAKTGSHADAAKKLKLALLFYPRNSNTFRFMLGRESRLAKDFPEAEKNLQKVLAKNASHFLALKELGLTYADSGQKEKAYFTFEKSAQLQPSDSEVLKYAAQFAFELKKFPEAVNYYENITKIGKAEAMDWYQLGLSYVELQKPAEAIASIQGGLKLNKQLKGANKTLATIFLSQDQTVPALEALKNEVAVAPEDAALAEMLAVTALKAGMESYSSKKLDEAAAYFKDGLSVASPKKAELHYQLAAVYCKQKNKKAFLEQLTEAITADPKLKAQAKKDKAFLLYKKSAEFQKTVR